MEKKVYNTKSRKLILDYLESQREKTISAADITDYLKLSGQNVNQTTVYRYLNKLTAERKILKFSEGDGAKAVYQIVSNSNTCHGHIHMQCTKCGKLVHLDCSFMDELKHHIKEEHNFSLVCEKSLLYGICDECRDK